MHCSSPRKRESDSHFDLPRCCVHRTSSTSIRTALPSLSSALATIHILYVELQMSTNLVPAWVPATVSVQKQPRCRVSDLARTKKEGNTPGLRLCLWGGLRPTLNRRSLLLMLMKLKATRWVKDSSESPKCRYQPETRRSWLRQVALQTRDRVRGQKQVTYCRLSRSHCTFDACAKSRVSLLSDFIENGWQRSGLTTRLKATLVSRPNNLMQSSRST